MGQILKIKSIRKTKKIPDVTNLVKKTDFNTKVTEIEGKIPDVSSLVTKSALADTSDLAKKVDLKVKITETEGKIPSITGLATNSALTAVENKIPYVSGLVKKTDYNTKISEIENKVNYHNYDKYITNAEFNTMAVDVFKARLAAQTDLIRKPDFDSTLKKFVIELLKIRLNTCWLKMN